MKKIHIIPITLFILFMPVLSARAASVNLLHWTQRELDIENQVIPSLKNSFTILRTMLE